MEAWHQSLLLQAGSSSHLRIVTPVVPHAASWQRSWPFALGGLTTVALAIWLVVSFGLALRLFRWL